MFESLKIAEKENIYIRMLTIRDTENILKWRNSPFVSNNFIFRDEITEEMHEDWIRTQVNEGKVIQFIIGDSVDNKEVGSVYFKNIDPRCESAEYGIFLDESAAGKGIGYKASTLAIKYMFDEFDLDYIVLRVLEKNAAAIHLYEKLGFKITEENIDKPSEADWHNNDLKDSDLDDAQNGKDAEIKENVIFMKLNKGDF